MIDYDMIDWYFPSTKDVKLKLRSGKMSLTVEIDDSYLCITDKNYFLNNYNNKEKIVNSLAAKLEGSSVKIVLSSSDTDATIVKLNCSMETNL